MRLYRCRLDMRACHPAPAKLRPADSLKGFEAPLPAFTGAGSNCSVERPKQVVSSGQEFDACGRGRPLCAVPDVQTSSAGPSLPFVSVASHYVEVLKMAENWWNPARPLRSAATCKSPFVHECPDVSCAPQFRSCDSEWLTTKSCRWPLYH